MIRKISFVLLFLINCHLFTYSQYYDSGQEPFSQWSIIKTEHFKVLFPASQEKKGKQYAALLEQNYTSGGSTLGHYPRRFPIVLHPYTAISNGMVNWAPRRSNLYLVAPYDNFYLPWEQHLALHEYRHIVQVDGLHRGTTKVLSWLVGEQAEGAVLGLHLPLWFIEGDAVAYETGATSAGRGRVGSFGMELKTQLKEKGPYSYPKAMFGSYADFVPDHYQLGYQLVTFGRVNYGPELWQKCLERVAWRPFGGRPFSKAIGSVTGLTEEEFYTACMDSLKAYNKTESHQEVTDSGSVDYSSYFMPFRYNDSLYIAYRENLSDLAAFVLTNGLSSGDEVICHPGFLSAKTFSFQYPWLVWNEYRLTRWELSNFSRIVAFNLVDKTKKVFANDGKVYGSKLSPDKKKMVSVEFNANAEWAITIRDFKDGIILKSYPFDTLQPTYVNWLPDSQQIGFIAIGNDGKYLAKYNPVIDTIEILTETIKNDIGNLICTEEYFFVTADYQNKPAWYRYHCDNARWELIKTSGNGVAGGSFADNHLIFSDYTSNGFAVNHLALTDTLGILAEKPGCAGNNYSTALSNQEKPFVYNPSDTNYLVKPYRRLLHLLNFHSWMPLAVKLDQNDFGPGLTFMSQDVLSTSFLTTGYQYYYTEERNNYFVDYKYKGFYPTIGLKAELDKKNFELYSENGLVKELDSKQKTLTIYINLPFVISSGAFKTGLQLESGYEQINYLRETGEYSRRFVRPQPFSAHHGYYVYYFEKGEPINLIYQTVYNSLYFYSLRRKSHRDLHPRLGIALLGSYMQHLNEKNNKQIALQSWVYMPGIGANQHLIIYGGYQEESKLQNLFNNQIRYPRGCRAVNNSSLATVIINYAFPFAYPDKRLGKFCYVKRLKMNGFYGMAQAQYKGNSNWFGSYGFDVTADVHFFKFLIPFEVGGTIARKLPYHEYYAGLIIKANISELY